MGREKNGPNRAGLFFLCFGRGREVSGGGLVGSSRGNGFVASIERGSLREVARMGRLCASISKIFFVASKAGLPLC